LAGRSAFKIGEFIQDIVIKSALRPACIWRRITQRSTAYWLHEVRCSHSGKRQASSQSTRGIPIGCDGSRCFLHRFNARPVAGCEYHYYFCLLSPCGELLRCQSYKCNRSGL